MNTKIKHRNYMRHWRTLPGNKEKKAKTDAAAYRLQREKRLRRAAAYRRQNHKQILAWHRAYQKRCPRLLRESYQRHMQKPENRLRGLFKHAVVRAVERGLEYDIRVKYLLVARPPTHCACCLRVLDYRIGRGAHQPDAPSLDRHDNTKGYTLANTRVICLRCNAIKRDATFEELRVIAKYAGRKFR